MHSMLSKSRLRRRRKNAASKLITHAFQLWVTKKKWVSGKDAKKKTSSNLTSSGGRTASLQLAALGVMKFQELIVARSVRTFKEVTADLRSVVRNEATDPEVHLAQSISNLDDKVVASSKEIGQLFGEFLQSYVDTFRLCKM